MKHTYNETQKERICQLIYDWLVNHKVQGGEIISQNENTQIDAINLMCVIADVKDVMTDVKGLKHNSSGQSIWDYLRAFIDGTDEIHYVNEWHMIETKNPKNIK